MCGPLPSPWTSAIVSTTGTLLGNTCAQTSGLIAVKDAVTVASWPAASLSGWTTSTDPCTAAWTGVSCAGTKVTALDLGFWNMEGTLPAALSKVTGLMSLSLGSNKLSGSLPLAWSVLTGLTMVDLSKNLLSSSLPVAWQTLASLSRMDLSDNAFVSTIPVAWMSGTPHMAAMARLTANNNVNMCGSFSATAWASVVIKNYADTSGLIAVKDAVTVASWPAASLSGWTTSTDPCTAAWTGVSCAGTKVTALDLGFWNMEGTLPAALSKVTGLMSLSLGSNKLSGSLPLAWSVLTGLTMVDLSKNLLSSSLPVAWQTLASLSRMDLSDNAFVSTIPVVWMSGTPHMAAMARLTANNNVNMCGSFAATAWASVVIKNYADAPPADSVALYQVKQELLTSGLIAVKDAVTVASWPAASLSGWTTSTDPCTAAWTGVSCAGTKVTALDLGFWNMEGTLPAALSKVTGLMSLSLGSNKLSGSLPLAWSVLTGLTMVDLSKNLLSSSLPVAWQTLASLSRMDLSDNAFVSTIPVVWMSGTPHMAAMARLTANNNVNMCGSFAATAWASVVIKNYADAPPADSVALYQVKQELLTSGLIAVKDAVTVASWPSLSGWTTSTDPCSAAWTGVSCAGTKVTALDLGFFNMEGSLPAALSKVTGLTSLNLGSNKLSGSLPLAWSVLTGLTVVDLSKNLLSSSLPVAWQTLASLSRMDLSDNAFVSTIPVAWMSGTPHMAAMARLTANNNTSGLIAVKDAVTVASWPAASLSGWTTSTDPCTAAWTGVSCAGTKVTALDLGFWNMEGTLPAALSKVTGLMSLSLGSNKLSGSLPLAWSVLTGLTMVDLSKNLLSSSLPVAWQTLASLSRMDLSDNAFVSTIPVVWMSGTPHMAAMARLTANNNVNIPPADSVALYQVKQELLRMDLSDNAFVSTIPVVWMSGTPHMAAMARLTANNNVNMCGSFAATAWASVVIKNYADAPPADSVALYQVKQELLTSGLIAVKDAVTVASWPSLSGWTTSTDPCSAAWTGVSCAGTKVTALDLGFFNMEGSLPAALSKVTGLTSLNLGSNKLSGSLPLAWSVLTGLTVVDLSKNLLSSSLPVAWQTLASLSRMDLSDNAFVSTIPVVWMSGTPHMAAMARLTANNNVNMCGSFSATAWASVVIKNYADTSGLIAVKDAVTVASWPSLSGWTTSTDPCSAAWTGVSCAGTKVTALDLGFFNMEGSLPAALSKVTGLTSLNLGSNKLSGSLPLAWSVLTGLTVVDLSKNLLSSSLPVAWQTLASLSRMDLSDNAFVSTIPVAWMSGTPHMAAMARLTANNNVNMCGSFSATAWASVVIKNYADPPPLPPSPPVGAVPSITLAVIWPNVEYAALIADPFAEEEFRMEYRIALANSTGTLLKNVVITGISPGSILINTVIMFDPAVSAAEVQAYMDRVVQNPTDVSWLFPTQPLLLTTFGTPSVVAVDSGLVFNVLAATCNRPARPPMAVYAPATASQRQFPLLITLTAAWDRLSLNTCGPNLACLFALRNGEVVANSLRRLDNASLQWVADVAVSVVNGPVDILLRADECNPASTPNICSVVSDMRSPSVSLVLEDSPSLANSTFTVRANFSESVQPLLPVNFTASGAVVRRVVFEGANAGNAYNSSALLVLDGTPGMTASLKLVYGAYTDLAQNGGAASNSLDVDVSSPGLSVASLTINIVTAAAMGASAATCMASAVFAPGWATLACGAGWLRSLGHLQFVGMSSSLAANMPTSFQEASNSARWSLLGFAPATITSFADRMSPTVTELEAEAATAEPRLPAVLPANSSVEGAISAQLLPYGPLTLVIVSSPDAPSNTSLITTGIWTPVSLAHELQPDALMAVFNGSAPLSVEVPTDYSGTLQATWHAAFSALVLGAIVLGIALAIHIGVAVSSDQQMRLAGLKGVYLAFPALMLLAAAAIMPAVLYAFTKLLAWESALSSSPPPVMTYVLVGIAAAAAAGLSGYLIYLTLAHAPSRVLLLPQGSGLGGTSTRETPSLNGPTMAGPSSPMGQHGYSPSLATTSTATNGAGDIYHMPGPPLAQGGMTHDPGSPLQRQLFEKRLAGSAGASHLGTGAANSSPLIMTDFNEHAYSSPVHGPGSGSPSFQTATGPPLPGWTRVPPRPPGAPAPPAPSPYPAPPFADDDESSDDEAIGGQLVRSARSASNLGEQLSPRHAGGDGETLPTLMRPRTLHSTGSLMPGRGSSPYPSSPRSQYMPETRQGNEGGRDRSRRASSLSSIPIVPSSFGPPAGLALTAQQLLSPGRMLPPRAPRTPASPLMSPGASFHVHANHDDAHERGDGEASTRAGGRHAHFAPSSLRLAASDDEGPGGARSQRGHGGNHDGARGSWSEGDARRSDSDDGDDEDEDDVRASGFFTSPWAPRAGADGHLGGSGAVAEAREDEGNGQPAGPVDMRKTRMSRVRDALAMGTMRTVTVMPADSPYGRNGMRGNKARGPGGEASGSRGGGSGGAGSATTRNPAGQSHSSGLRGLRVPGLGEQRRQGRAEAQPELDAVAGTTSDGRDVVYTSDLGRSTWWASYGWLINDVVGTTSHELMERQCRKRCLVANALYVLQMCLTAGILGGFSSTPGDISYTQLGAALTVQVLWLQYVAVIRPFENLKIVVLELVLSVLQTVVLVFALTQAVGVTMTPSPAVICMTLLFCIAGLAASIEVVRAILVFIAMLRSKARSRTRKVIPTTSSSGQPPGPERPKPPSARNLGF
ncbi:hypothetical protein FOA52_000462 [Chlamydomonas sp. UWO 241]|nr:hypothetical protein FOA52_000462 [Chlamydomonas sp. UWO 241]